jgi:hypothetical protein
MVALKNGTWPSDPRLDRVPSDVTEHLERYPLTAALADELRTGVVQGVNWYSRFDDPIEGRDGRWRVLPGPRVDLGRRRGGHAIFTPARGSIDAAGWYSHYNQGREGRCVQFAVSRLMSHLRRARFRVDDSDAGRWLYWEAQRADEWQGGEYPNAAPTYAGTSVRAGFEVLRTQGIVRYRAERPSPALGVQAYRWLRTVDELVNVTGRYHASEVPWHNSWGSGYPRTVWVPLEVHERLLREDGEYGVVTPR